MGIIGKIKLAIIISGLISGGVVAYLGKDLMNAGVEDYSVDRIRSIDSSGFNVDMSITVNNPSDLTLEVEEIKYKGVLRDSGEIVARGSLKGLKLPKGENTTIELSPRINWIPSSNLALKYATQDEVWMDLELDITVYNFIPVTSISVPIDIKEVFSQSEKETLPPVIGSESEEDNSSILPF